jgi:hypothetical protein
MLNGISIHHLLKRVRGCCMHVFLVLLLTAVCFTNIYIYIYKCFDNPYMKINKQRSFGIHPVFCLCITGNNWSSVVVCQFKINLDRLFIKQRVLLMNFLLKFLHYLPINGSVIHILGKLLAVAIVSSVIVLRVFMPCCVNIVVRC